MNRLYLFLCIALLFSCEEQKSIGGFHNRKIDYNGKLQPKSIKDYPKEIDSLVYSTLDKEYNEDFEQAIRVSHSLLIKKNEDGEQIAYLDTLNYTVVVDVMKKGKLVDRWNFEINRQLKIVFYRR